MIQVQKIVRQKERELLVQAFVNNLQIFPIWRILFLFLFKGFEIHKLFLFLFIQKNSSAESLPIPICGKYNYLLNTALVSYLCPLAFQPIYLLKLLYDFATKCMDQHLTFWVDLIHEFVTAEH